MAIKTKTKNSLSWKAPQYQHHEKSVLWFVLAAIALVGFVVYGLSTDGWTFSVAMVVFAGTYYLMQRHTPPIVNVIISNNGVKIGRYSFPYGNLKSFWIVSDPPFVNKLYLRMESRMHPDIFVSLDGADPDEVRKALGAHIQEHKGKHEPFSDSLVRLFKL